MSSAEARQRFVTALVARLISEEQLQVLRNARIEDEGPEWELASAMAARTPQQLGESITLMLEANPSWPDEAALAELEKFSSAVEAMSTYRCDEGGSRGHCACLVRGSSHVFSRSTRATERGAARPARDALEVELRDPIVPGFDELDRSTTVLLVVSMSVGT